MVAGSTKVALTVFDGESRRDIEHAEGVNMKTKLVAFALLSAVTLCVANLSAAAQEFPTREIKLIVGFPAGGGASVQARIFADHFAKAVKQTVVVENKPGAGAALATRLVAAAPADGYTILFSASNMVTNLLGLKEPGYKWEDFALVGGINYLPNVLIVNTASSGAKTLPELVAFGKAHPGELTFGTNGPQSSPNLMARRFAAISGIGWREVPYKGAAQVVQDMLGGRIDAFFGLPSTGMGVLGNSNMAILAVTDVRRLPSLPDVPTFVELGYPALDDIQIGGIWVPAATSKPVIEKLRTALAETLKSGEFKAQLEKIGALIYTGTPEEFDRVVLNIESKYRADFQAFDIAPE